MMGKKVVVTAAVRTPIGRYLGSLKNVPASDLLAVVLNAVVERSSIDPEQVDDVIIGQAYQNGDNVNIARMGLLSAGWPVEIPGITIDRRCLSGIDSVCMGVMKIAGGFANVVVAGGVESMSRTEFFIPGELIKWGVGGFKDPKWGLMPRGHGAMPMWGIPFFDRIQRARVMSQPVERFGELNSMMTWAEAAAKKENISRQEADLWSLSSHEKALRAIQSGRFRDELVPVEVPQKKGNHLLYTEDETPRSDVTIEKLGRLPAVYDDGICTAGNSSTENDGAAAVVLMPQNIAEERGLDTLGEIVSFGVAASDPRLTYPAVPAAVDKALSTAGLSIADLDLIEIQEAFAAQVLADIKLMGLTEKAMHAKVNVNGSGISLGHPIGATGTMRLVTLLHEMKKTDAGLGLVTICGGGGQGIALIVKK